MSDALIAYPLRAAHGIVLDANAVTIAECDSGVFDAATARRIAAALNATRHLTIEQLEAGTFCRPYVANDNSGDAAGGGVMGSYAAHVANQRDDARAELDRLRAVNAELRAALVDIEVQSNHTFPWGSHVERLTRINEITQHAIAMASEVTP